MEAKKRKYYYVLLNKRKRWDARIWLGGKLIYIGLFDTFHAGEKECKARLALAKGGPVESGDFSGYFSNKMGTGPYE